jgi:hypothetical protein
VLHAALQILYYDLIEMHKLTPNIQEVIAFTKWLSDKQILRNVLSEVCCIAIFGPLEQMLP